MTDLPARILARVAQLEQTARAAGGADEYWTADGATVHRGHPTDAVVDYTDAAAHIATWDPPAVLTFCAGARWMIERHEPLDDSCVDDDGEDYPVISCLGNHRASENNWPCADIDDLARMLGVDPG